MLETVCGAVRRPPNLESHILMRLLLLLKITTPAERDCQDDNSNFRAVSSTRRHLSWTINKQQNKPTKKTDSKGGAVLVVTNIPVHSAV